MTGSSDVWNRVTAGQTSNITQNTPDSDPNKKRRGKSLANDARFCFCKMFKGKIELAKYWCQSQYIVVVLAHKVAVSFEAAGRGEGWAGGSSVVLVLHVVVTVLCVSPVTAVKRIFLAPFLFQYLSVISRIHSDEFLLFICVF